MLSPCMVDEGNFPAIAITAHKICIKYNLAMVTSSDNIGSLLSRASFSLAVKSATEEEEGNTHR